MAISIGMTLVAKYDKDAQLYRAFVHLDHGDSDYVDCVGQGRSPDEARGHLLREMILAGMNNDMVFLDVETEED